MKREQFLKKVTEIRLCIYEPKGVTFVPVVDDDFSDNLLSEVEASTLMRQGIPVVVAVGGGGEKHTNYESKAVKLKKV